MLVKTQLRPGGAQSDRLRTRINLALIGVFLVFAALWILLLWYRYDQTIKAGEHRAENLDLILTEHLRRSVDAVDAALVQLALHSERVGGPRAGTDTWTPVLKAAHAGISSVSSITLLDDKGVVTASTMPGIAGQSRSDHFLFQQLSRRPDNSLIADRPARSPATGHVLLPLGRALTGPDGRFTGVIMADRKSTRLNSSLRQLVCRLLLEKKKRGKEKARSTSKHRIRASHSSAALIVEGLTMIPLESRFKRARQRVCETAVRASRTVSSED